MIELEDNVGDIVGKAQRGLEISDSELAEKSGADSEAIRKVREGREIAANIERESVHRDPMADADAD